MPTRNEPPLQSRSNLNLLFPALKTLYSAVEIYFEGTFNWHTGTEPLSARSSSSFEDSGLDGKEDECEDAGAP